MRQLYYFNGFNSAIPDAIEPGSKLDETRQFCAREGLEFKPVSIDYRKATEQREEILDSLPRTLQTLVFTGTSMGGWFSRIMQVSAVLPGRETFAVAFNPVAWVEKMRTHEGAQYNFVTGERYHWGPEDSRQLCRLEASVAFDTDLPFWVFCDKGDELIDWRESQRRFASIARFHAFEGGEHRFTHAREAWEMVALSRH